MPVYAKLTVLQTYVAELDVLLAQMAQTEACRSELEEKVFEIEEKEDNHTVYLEAHLERLSLAQEDKKLNDDSEGKGAKV